MNARQRGPQLVLLVTMSALLLAGCGPLPGQSGAAPNTSEPAQAGQGGQNQPTGYTDARYKYRITGPGPLSAKPDGTASFVGEDEQLEVKVVEGDRAADPSGLAQSEVNSLSSTSANFRTTSGPAKVTLGGQSMVKVTYTWSAKSQAAGTQLKKTGVRYYISKTPAILAVVRYEDASSEFDQKEADGFAGSFRWL